MQKSIAFAGTYVGSMVGTQPLTMAVRKFGAHKTMFIVGIASSALAAVTPFIMLWSFPFFVFVRFVAGFGVSNLFTVAGIVVADWASMREKGVFIAVLSGHVELCPLISMPLTALVAENANWPLVFYIHGALCAACACAWLIYYCDRPERHPFVGDDEFTVITKGKAVRSDADNKPPISLILRSAAIWSVWAAVIGNFIVSQFSITFLPMYLSYVLGYAPAVAGSITPLPLIVVLVIKLVTGISSDKITCVTESMKARLFNTLGLLGSGLFFLLVAMIQPSDSIADVLLVMIPVALLGFHAGGFPKAAVVVSQQYSPFVMSVVQMLAMVSLLIGSFIVPALTPHNTFDEWRNVFILYAALLIVSNTLFVLFARVEPAKWTQAIHPDAVVRGIPSPSSSSSNSIVGHL